MRTRTLFALLLLVCAASTARAQPSQISGVVRDDTGGPLPGASVELRSIAGLLPQEVVTDNHGGFRFDISTVGLYHTEARVRLDTRTPDAIVGFQG